jgi:ornithine cyclodeaminase/alanine dehydrogenase-like protein (mu-crystallin family)
MIAFSEGTTRQLLRSIIPLGNGHLFGIMPGALGEHAAFGAKLVSVYPENFSQGRQSHQGLVVLFEPATGEPVCVVHAGEITAIRTAAASAVATHALARPDASRLAILGYGEQAAAPAPALRKVRPPETVSVWGRSPPDVQEAVGTADIICTVTSAAEPILQGSWVQAGTHLNVVGSSIAGPVEVDDDLVVRSRFIADSREGVLRQGAEFLRAKQAGLIGDEHIVAEIGEVLAGRIAGRRSRSDITLYKSLGHVVQDLASAWALFKS